LRRAQHSGGGRARCPADGDRQRAKPPSYRGTVVASKIRNRLEVGRQPAQKPHDLDIARTLALQPARRAHFVEVAIKIKLQQVPRIVGRPSGHRRHRPPEAEASHVKTIYKRVDHPNRGIRRYIVLNRRRQQCRLTTILALNVAHEKGRIVVDAAFLIRLAEFSHSLCEAVFLFASIFVAAHESLHGPLRHLVQRKRMSAFGGKAEVVGARSKRRS
jgi:hypothetical protein